MGFENAWDNQDASQLQYECLASSFDSALSQMPYHNIANGA